MSGAGAASAWRTSDDSGECALSRSLLADRALRDADTWAVASGALFDIRVGGVVLAGNPSYRRG